jgi:hypothetical protein
MKQMGRQQIIPKAAKNYKKNLKVMLKMHFIFSNIMWPLGRFITIL